MDQPKDQQQAAQLDAQGAAPVQPAQPPVQPVAQPVAPVEPPKVEPKVEPKQTAQDDDLRSRLASLEAQIAKSQAQAVMARAGIQHNDPEIEDLILSRFKASGQADFGVWFESIKANPPAVLKPFITPATPAQPGSRIVSAVNPGAQSGQGTAGEYTPEQIRELGRNPAEWAKHKDAILAQLARKR